MRRAANFLAQGGALWWMRERMPGCAVCVGRFEDLIFINEEFLCAWCWTWFLGLGGQK